MPTYDYVCDACGHEFELFQAISADPLKKCPECRKSKLRRLFGTGAALMFKGSGFYQTDYRSESYKKAAAADKSDGSATGKSDGKSDSKTSGKSDAATAPKAEPVSSAPNSTGKSSSGKNSSGKKTSS
ncbi:MAG: FmdB family zinc ribbon protein [Pirellulaceae bacterium]